MSNMIIAYDLGTSGCKASLFDSEGCCLFSCTSAYPTYYPRQDRHEQKPEEWWSSVCSSTRDLLEQSAVNPSDLAGLAISGHSLGVIPVDKEGTLLQESVPIWSDRRAVEQADLFFQSFSIEKWYGITGNGFAKECYPVFKLQWLKENEPEIWKRTDRILGTKDYINYLLTGVKATDRSYASGSGLYDLRSGSYSDILIHKSGLPASLWPEPVLSTEIIGEVTAQASLLTGLPEGLPVCAGGVDNSCMALGAGNLQEGHVYLSLGSSAWIAVSSSEPVLDYRNRPFVFEHVVPGLYTSATSIFSACSSLNWFVNTLCPDLVAEAEKIGRYPNDHLMDIALRDSFAGSRSVYFNPSLSGGAEGDPRANILGSLRGIRLGTSRADIIRSVFEGIAFDLALRYRELASLTDLNKKLLVVGGGSKSPQWLQMFADIFGTTVVKGSIDQEAGSLGAAALAAVGTGLWEDFSPVKKVNITMAEYEPDREIQVVYQKELAAFERIFYPNSGIQ